MLHGSIRPPNPRPELSVFFFRFPFCCGDCLRQQGFPDLPDKPYDLIVLGSGPGGEAAAVQAARLGASVAVVEIKKSFGGPTGLTSKAVREAAKQINQAVKNVGNYF